MSYNIMYCTIILNVLLTSNFYVTGKSVRSRFEVRKQRLYGYPAEQMVQWSALRQPRTRNFGSGSTDTAGCRCVLRRFSHAGLWHRGGRDYSLLGTRFLSLRVAQTSADSPGLDLEESKHNVRQSSTSIYLI